MYLNTDAEEICIAEIAKLKKFSNERTLTKDEIKSLEILIKSLEFVESRRANKEKNILDEMPEEELLKQLEQPN